MTAKAGTRSRPKRRQGRARRYRWPSRRLVGRLLIGLALVLVVLPMTVILAYRVVPPPITPLMVVRLIEGEGLARDWQPLDRIARDMTAAVIAAEDNRFCQHNGFDMAAIAQAVEEYRAGGRLRGASTISMQTTKNILLWPGRGWLRKGLEAYLTPFVELAWPKRRIMEVYLNIAEFGPGIYGVEAAARHAFGKSAEALTRREASLLAATLPNPRERSAAQPSAYVDRYARTIAGRIDQVAPLIDCL